MKIVNVEVTGDTPYLMHKFSDESSLEKKTRRVAVSNLTPREWADKVAYINDEGHYYISAFSITGCMANAGTNHKMTGSRKSMKYVVAGGVRITSDIIVLLNGSLPAPDFEVDSRPVTIPATKGRIMRHRPRFDKWNLNFDLVVNDNLIDPAMAHRLLNEAGVSVGIGDYRPSKGGPFGCFRVTKFEIV